jgi:hypothetical protein
MHVDDTNKIQRLVRKDVLLGEAGWIDPRFWDGDVRDRHGKTPAEMVNTKDMSTLRYSVQLRAEPDAAHVDHDLLAYRMYFAFAPYGDLHSLLERHIHPRGNATHIPEPFVWCMAEALAKCGKVMWHGDLETPKDGWKGIVHRQVH